MRATLPLLTLLFVSLAACGGSATVAGSTEAVAPSALAAAGPYAGPPLGDGVERVSVPVAGTEPTKGPDDALVTIVIFSDFQCPFCSRVLPALTRLEQAYADDVRFVWRNMPLPFHENAMPAAALAVAAHAHGGNALFWRAHDRLFEMQRDLSRDRLQALGQELGLSTQTIQNALDGAQDNAKIRADMAVATQAGVRGTPGFVINGEVMMGAQPYESFVDAVERARSAAQFVLRNGAARNGVYDAVLAAGTSGGEAEETNMADAEAPAEGAPESPIYQILAPADVPSSGPADALVTVVIFSDFQCPFCSRVEPTLTELRVRYANDLRLVWMNNPLPFHQQAMPAAIAAQEAFVQRGDEGFWAMHQRLFANQRELTRPNLERWAQEVGLDMQAFRAALDTNRHQQFIEAQQAVANGLGARGTPSFFVNGELFVGAQPLERFIEVVDRQRARAQALLDSGTPRAGLYAALIAGGRTEALPRPTPRTDPAPDPDTRHTMETPPNAPTRGAANPQITLHLYSDFQCPFCGRIRPTMDRILQEYGNRVQVVWHNYPLPFHQNAMPAAHAAQEVFHQLGNEAFWRYHDLLFDNQRNLDLETLVRLSQQVGANTAEVRAAVTGNRYQQEIQAHMRLPNGVRIGTPSTFVNGVLVQGAQPYETFRQHIERELNR